MILNEEGSVKKNICNNIFNKDKKNIINRNWNFNMKEIKSNYHLNKNKTCENINYDKN